MRRRLILAASLLTLAALAWQGCSYHRFLGLACGYAAKVACSCVLVGGRDLESVRAQELAPFGLVDVVVDPALGIAEASVFGIWHRRAVYRDGLGATLVLRADHELRPARLAAVARRDGAHGVWPAGERVDPAPRDDGPLAAAVAAAFVEPDLAHPQRTRAVVVVQRGRIVAERYAEGFAADTPQHGWSMTKSLMNALVGVLVRQGRLRVADRAPVPEWQGADDGRAAITVDQLLRMESGFEFTEVYDDESSDAPRMLFGADDMAAYAATRPLRAPPDTEWRYSSGTSVLVARAVRAVVGDAEAARFARDELFAPLGMATALIEPDAVGTWVGSSMGWASARDWARFGLLYLRDGVWDGARILPEGWVAYTVTPTAHADLGRFGAHFWLNAGDADGARVWPSLPADLFWAAGFQGQFVVVAPSHDAVIVRLGQTADSEWFPVEGFVGAVLAALPD